MRRAFVPFEEMRIIERPDWMQLVTPSFRRGGLNQIAFAALDAGEADRVIEETIAEYRQLGIQFRWLVVPGSKPDDLAQRLERHGLRKSAARAMYARTLVRVSATREVEEVNEESLRDFTRVTASGWGQDEEPLERYHRAVLNHPERRQRLFLARVGNEPAAVGAYMAFERSAYLLGAVVLPDYRGRGLYRALIEARLRHAALRGLTLATTHAREETSAPMLEHIGFSTVCRFSVFSGP